MYEHIFSIDVIISQTIIVIGNSNANFMTLIVFSLPPMIERSEMNKKSGVF
jgi:hypothetical protein